MKITTALCLAVLLLCGCVRVPMTVIKIPLSGGRSVIVEAPKDSTIDGLKVNFATGTLELDHYQAKTNPEVIASTGMAQVELLRAYSELVNAGIAAGVKAAISGSAPVK